MKKELIGIIAAYWGAECSFEYISIDGVLKDTQQLKAELLAEITNPLFESQGGSNISNFKLHLRPLWSITEAELRELAEVLGWDNTTISADSDEKYVNGRIAKSTRVQSFWVAPDGIYGASVRSETFTAIINHLRAKGFCVDQALVDAGLVEWKEVNK